MLSSGNLNVFVEFYGWGDLGGPGCREVAFPFDLRALWKSQRRQTIRGDGGGRTRPSDSQESAGSTRRRVTIRPRASQ